MLKFTTEFNNLMQIQIVCLNYSTDSWIDYWSDV